MEAELVAQFRGILPRLVVYLVIPFYLGMQLTMLSKEERGGASRTAGSYALDIMGLSFGVGVTAFVLVASLYILKMGSTHPEVAAVLFRYGLMFLFYGMWWQFFIIMGLKAYRDRNKEGGKLKYVVFYTVGSVFVSLLAFMNSEWFLKYMSLGFLAMAAPILLLSYRRMSLAFMAAAVVAFAVQTAGYIYISSIA